jgi:hypothetical protein
LSCSLLHRCFQVPYPRRNILRTVFSSYFHCRWS